MTSLNTIPTDASKWTAVVIDDEPDNIGVILMVLNFHGVQVKTANSGAEGLTLLRDERPTFVLLDIVMPGCDGYHVLEDIRADYHLSDLVVIACTAQAMEGEREKALAAGFDGYITKPVSVTTLFDEIKTHVGAKVQHHS